MSYITKELVMGAKSFKGTIEGRSFDSTTIFCQTKLDESQGNAKGFTGASYVWGSAENYDKIKHLPFPFEAELTMETVTSGNKVRQVCVGFKPLSLPKDQPKAAA